MRHDLNSAAAHYNERETCNATLCVCSAGLASPLAVTMATVGYGLTEPAMALDYVATTSDTDYSATKLAW